MHIYRIIDAASPDEALLGYEGTLAEAHTNVKKLAPHRRPDARIELIDVGTDKASIINLLECQRCNERLETPALRAWKVSERGGLSECPVGE